jgi:hypothetical protein
MRNYRFFISFLIGMFLSIILLFINVIVFFLLLFGSNVIVIIVLSICGGILALCIGGPTISFIGYHISLAIRGLTTR